jgi:hypothetical protein
MNNKILLNSLIFNQQLVLAFPSRLWNGDINSWQNFSFTMELLGMDWIHVIQDKIMFWDFLNMEINIIVPKLR